MSIVTSFPPIATSNAKILILGSMPGIISLDANQYYANRRNSFWPMMATLYGFDAQSSYEIRVQHLRDAEVALWDVLHECIRPGSLDSSIKKGSRVPNDFQAFFNQHPTIQLIAFNGTEAEKSFKRYVLPTIDSTNLTLVLLPSSSPAHAISLEHKVAAWRTALQR